MGRCRGEAQRGELSSGANSFNGHGYVVYSVLFYTKAVRYHARPSPFFL